MVLKTSGTWYDQIREVTETEEYQTATIKILDRGLMEMGEYDPKTDSYPDASSEEDAIVYEGRARLIGVRWGVDRTETNLSNPQTLLPIRVQLPRDELPGIVRKGSIVTVLEAPGNEAIVGRPMSVTLDFHGSSGASRTIQCRISGDVIGD